MPQSTSSQLDDAADENVSQNMVSNLPLLFAAGYPTSLDKITESQLEKFIPFMVQCSLGFIHNHNIIEYSEPEWWPEDVPFSIPLVKPRDFKHTWHAKLRHIVIICYSFHKGVFLLRFCNELAGYQPECLRFINNHNSTTSLFNRDKNKLLVTFRNENMLYDQLPIYNKKTLLPRAPSSSLPSMESSNNEHIVEPALFDIYLCDNCEAELYSMDAFLEHEKTCEVDDDVIFCGSEDIEPIDENLQRQQSFLHNFNLFNGSMMPPSNKSPTKRSKELQQQQQLESPEAKLRRLPRRSRALMVLSKCPTIAISSPAGKQLIKSSKAIMSNEYLMERLDRSERFCHAPTLSNTGSRPKFMDKKFNYTNISCNFKRPPGYYYRYYSHPRRQFSERHRQEAFLSLNAAELKQCTPISVRTKRLTIAEIAAVQLRLAALRRSRAAALAAAVAEQHNASGVPRSKFASNVVDIIDLCSSDEEMDEISAAAFDDHNNHHHQHRQFTVAESNRFDDKFAILPHSQIDCSLSDPTGSNSSHSSRDGSLSQTASTPRKNEACSSYVSTAAAIAPPTSSITIPGLIQLTPVPPQSPAQPLQPSVFIFSNLTQTSLTLTNRKYKYENQENSFIILNGAKCSSSIPPESATQPAAAAITNPTTTTTATVVAAAAAATTNNNNNSNSSNNNNNNNHLSSSNAKLVALLRPDVVLERVQQQPQQQISIDLT